MSEMISRIKIPVYDEQLDNVSEAIRRGQLVFGPHLNILQERLSHLFNKRYVLLTANGFSSIFLALKAVVPPNQNVLTSPASTCFACVNAINAAGHKIVFADMDMISASLPVLDQRSMPLFAVAPDHFGVLAPACKQWSPGNGMLIEDACQSFISRSKEPTKADAVIISFYPTKLINGIDGGAILTDNVEIYERAKSLCYYADQYHYEEVPRYNLKMNNINAALVLGTLDHLDQIAERMVTLYCLLGSQLDRCGMQYLKAGDNEVPSRLIMIAERKAQKNDWVQKLTRNNIQASSELIYVCPEEFVASMPVTKQLVENSFSIPLHPLLTDDEILAIERALSKL